MKYIILILIFYLASGQTPQREFKAGIGNFIRWDGFKDKGMPKIISDYIKNFDLGN